MNKRHLLLLLFLLSGLLSAQATTFKAVANGNWTDNIWDQPGYPGINDDVIIDGYHVSLNGSTEIEINNLTLLTSDTLNATALAIVSGGTLKVNNDLYIISDQDQTTDFGSTITLNVYNADLVVGKDFKILREELDTNREGIIVGVSGSSSVDVSGNMSFIYNASFNQDVEHLLSFTDNSILSINGNLTGEVHDKNNFSFSFSEMAILNVGSVALNSFNDSKVNFTHNSSATSYILGDLSVIGSGANGDITNVNLNAGILNINGNLDLTSDDANQIVRLHIDGIDNSLVVNGVITLDAQAESTAVIALNQTSILEVNNEIKRSNVFGSLFMNPTSTVIFNVTGSNPIPANNLEGSGVDKFEFSNIKLVNPFGMPVKLTEPMSLNMSLELDQTIIETDSINILILKEGATITGGSPDAYIDGPIERRGASSESVLMPLGDQGIYAPIEISPIGDPSTIIRGEFFGDPPPIGGIPPDLDRVNDNQHWIIDRVAGSPVDVVMHWTDGEASDISSLDSITTVYLDTTTDTWINSGRGTITGSNGPGQAGSISSDLLGDPPPIGAVTITIGTVSTNSVLPVELLAFNAIKENNYAQLNWTTASEINVSHFELERSLDGISFIKIGNHTANGGSSTETKYSFVDKSPEVGMNYYRLRSVDLDESNTVSRIQSVNFQRLETPIAVPNPVREQLQVRGLNPTAHSAMVEVYNPSGQLLFQQEVEANSGTIELKMEAVNITSNGTYFLRIIEASTSHNITLYKK